MNKRRIGGIFENMAADYLVSQGLLILERNYRCRMGEVDLIARDGNYLVFVEVKYRNSSRNGNAAEEIGRASCRERV